MSKQSDTVERIITRLESQILSAKEKLASLEQALVVQKQRLERIERYKLKKDPVWNVTHFDTQFARKWFPSEISLKTIKTETEEIVVGFVVRTHGIKKTFTRAKYLTYNRAFDEADAYLKRINHSRGTYLN